MSQLKFNELQGLSNVVRVAHPNAIYAPGHVIQVKWNMSMERFYYAIPNNDGGMRADHFAEGSNQGGTIIRPLDITIIPKSVNSFIHVEFNMFYEGDNNIVFSILRDGQLVGAQFQSGGNDGRWVGAGVARYDNNGDSTPSYINLPWIDRPGTTSAVTYSIAAKSGTGSNYTLTLNSTLSNYQFGSDAYEQGVSFSIAQEIAF
jgi:hypothetical protein